MKHKVAITDRAFDELDSACLWWAKHRSSEQALRWYNGFIKAIRELENNPECHSLAPENHAFGCEVRQLPYGLSRRPTHRALFTIRGDLVLVLRVRHLAQKEVSPDD